MGVQASADLVCAQPWDDKRKCLKLGKICVYNFIHI